MSVGVTSRGALRSCFVACVTVQLAILATLLLAVSLSAAEGDRSGSGDAPSVTPARNVPYRSPQTASKPAKGSSETRVWGWPRPSKSLGREDYATAMVSSIVNIVQEPAQQSGEFCQEADLTRLG